MSFSLLAAAPALPLHKAGSYVAAAYIVFVVLLVVYLGIMALRTGRTEREVSTLRRELELRRHDDRPDDSDPEREEARVA